MHDERPPRPPPLGLTFEVGAAVAEPRESATVLPLREQAGRLEVYCIQRSTKSAFLGGAVVFPGGKVDEADRETTRRTTGPAHPRVALLANDDDGTAATFVVAAARELLEEAAILPTTQPIDGDATRDLRRAMLAGAPFATVLAERGLFIAAGAFVPFARWITPEAEPRRFDARFFLCALPPGQAGEVDAHEATSGFWATPNDVLERFERGAIQLAPPTTRCLELLGEARAIAEAFAIAERQSLAPICPFFVPGPPPFLALPGDPAHPTRERAVAGPTRFVLIDGRFVGRDP